MADKTPPTSHHSDIQSLNRLIGKLRQALGKVQGAMPQLNKRLDDLKADVKQLQEESKQHDKQITVMKFRMRIMAGLIVLLFALVTGMSWDGVAQFILRFF